MKITFKINYTQFILHDASVADLSVITRLQSLDFSNDDTGIKLKEKPKDINFHQDNDIEIVGVDKCQEAQASARIAELKAEGEFAALWSQVKDFNHQGADANRLAKCIMFAAEQGLAITEHTQAGVNENSGNVWLWDEDWTGCIYQNIQNQGPFISWTCPNCGEEFDCETMIESDERTNWSYDHDDKCETCVGN